MEKLRSAIRTVPDFPKPGIQFKDITPLLADPDCFREAIDAFRNRLADREIDVVAGIEARGFVFASALAYALGAGTCLVRKPGKLPHAVRRQTYELEYGTDAVEVHADAFSAGQRIAVFDDVLATGGTASATLELIRRHFEVEIVEVCFLVELETMGGRQRLAEWPIHALLRY